MTMLRALAAAVPLLVIASPGASQQVTATGRPVASSSDAEPDDIVVTGYRSRKAPGNRVDVPATVSTVSNRIKYGYSERFAKCAARSKLSSLARLRVVVDGEVNSARARGAQDRLMRTYITCAESPSFLSNTLPPQTANEVPFVKDMLYSGDFYGVSPGYDTTPLGVSIYDRGALTIAAMKRFAPSLTLARADVDDVEVQRRFNLREIPRNRLRLPLDRKYFQVAVCMVRVEPKLSVRLALSEGGARMGDVQEALIDRARACVGGARKVKVDPTQFRLYIADAVYRWVVAARDIASLIPSDDQLASTDVKQKSF